MKRIFLLVDDYIPKSTKIHGKMMHQLAVEFAKQGHYTTVATPDCNVKGKYSFEKHEGVNIYRFKAKETRVNSKIKRAINESLISYYAWKNLEIVINEERYDLIITYSPTIFFGPFVKKIKAKWNAKCFLILRDIFPQWAIDQGLMKNSSVVTKYFKIFEKLNYRVSDRIALQSPRNKEWFDLNKKEFSSKTSVLFNWTNELNNDSPKSGYYRKKYNIEDKFIFFYGGNIGEAQDMMNLIRLAEKMQEYKNAFFVFAGSGNEYQKIEKAISDKKMSNVLLLPPVSQEDYKKMIKEFDVGLFSLHKNHSTHNFPGKLLGYMASNMPILGSVNVNNDVKEVIEDANAGFISINGNDEEFFKNGLELLQNENTRNKMGTNSNTLLKSQFSTEIAIKEILNS